MNILGLHLDFPFLKISLVRKTRKGIDVRFHRAVSLIPEEETDTPKSEANFEGPYPNVKRLYIENFRGKVVSGLAAKDFLIRSVDVHALSQKHVEETIAFQSEALSHFKPGEVITVPFLEKNEKGKAEALLFTIPRDGLREHLEEMNQLGFDPDVVSTVPSALCHFVRWKFPKLTDALVVDLGSNIVSCASLEKGKLKKAHSIPVGIEGLLSALYEDRKRILLKKEIEGAAKQIDLLLLKPHLNPRLSQELNALRQELAKVYYSFTRNSPRPVIFTGRSDAFVHFREFLFDTSEGDWPLSVEEQKFAVSLGHCLEQASNRPLQLRKGEFFPRKNWIRMGAIALALLCASFLLGTAFLGLGIHYCEKGKERMLSSLQTPLRKDLLNEGSMEEQIDYWIEAIENNNKEYPYILQAPRVSEFLSWLSSHPLLEELKQQGDPIRIREIRYQLVNFPSIHTPNEPYSTKVEIEFQFKSMMNARKFHEALRAGDEWVNSTLEITWDTLSDWNRSSFYLKTRSPYVP